jgi:chemotaxis protein methyltransferase CheR
MPEKQREFPYTQRDFGFLRRLAYERTGIVVGDDKYDMFYARLSRRVRKLGLDGFAAYCGLLRQDPAGPESLELVNAITTNLTAFFRENHHFEYLSRTLAGEHLARHASAQPLRIWSAGCSTGEEPYSIAMGLLEILPAQRVRDLDILATDIDSNVLATAAGGVYSQERVSGIDNARLRRWFLRGKGRNAGSVRVKPEVRRHVRFGQLNLMQAWQLEHPLDVIFCRNVIIYFGKEDKIRLVDRYADTLRPGGYLFIGHSESLFQISDRFELIGNTIYRKKGLRGVRPCHCPS